MKNILSASAEDKAMQTLIAAWKALQVSLANCGVANGDMSIKFLVQGRLDGDEPKATIELYHYHYQGFEASKTIHGLEYDETANELLRHIDRGQRLLRLSHKKED